MWWLSGFVLIHARAAFMHVGGAVVHGAAAVVHGVGGGVHRPRAVRPRVVHRVARNERLCEIRCGDSASGGRLVATQSRCDDQAGLAEGYGQIFATRVLGRRSGPWGPKSACRHAWTATVKGWPEPLGRS